MISQFTKTLGDAGVNIANMTNKSKGDYAYTMLDVASPIDGQVAEALKAIEHVYRVRIVKSEKGGCCAACIGKIFLCRGAGTSFDIL